MIISGGLRTPAQVHEAFDRTGADAVALARGSLGNPWLFAQLLGGHEDDPTREEILAELHWVMDSAVEHLGEERAGRYLRKFYPWYVERLQADKPLQDALQRAETLQAARAVLTCRRFPAMAGIPRRGRMLGGLAAVLLGMLLAGAVPPPAPRRRAPAWPIGAMARLPRHRHGRGAPLPPRPPARDHRPAPPRRRRPDAPRRGGL